ncbi:hypothetical protein HYT23_05390 [Candidatus Pacearchaeota archaeon]|nr:hypothetical protein [Candidatus Pacearchaeota archaeon]
MKQNIRKYSLEDYQELLKFYKEIDEQYLPRLSEREGGLEAHILNILNRDGGFFLFLEYDKIEGACGYFPEDKSKKVVNFTLFSFTERYWNTWVPYKLAKHMVEQKDYLGYMNVEKFLARTFYNKSAERLEKLGFRKIAEIKNDIIAGRTSYYYEADAGIVLGKFMRRMNQIN